MVELYVDFRTISEDYITEYLYLNQAAQGMITEENFHQDQQNGFYFKSFQIVSDYQNPQLEISVETIAYPITICV